MASTQFSQGLSGDKPTSRVLRPPGGCSSNIFGNTDEASNNNTAKEARDQGDTNKSRMESSSVFGPSTESPKAQQTKAENGEAEPDKKEGEEEIDEEKDTKTQPKARAYNPITGEAEKPKETTQRMGLNPITGEDYSQAKNVHTSTKVRQPPGGASTRLW